MGALPMLQPAFRALPRYGVAEGRGAFRRLDFNEGPSPDPAYLAELLPLCAHPLTVYPEYGGLKRAAARAWGLDPAQVLVLNGADEGISLTLRAFCGPEAPLTVLVPSFPMYRVYGAQVPCPVQEAPLDEAFQVDLKCVLETWPPGSLLALCSPNNPTGRAIPADTLRALLEASAGRPVLLDETYAPFCGQDGSAFLAEFPNLLLLRSLSKAFGVPGLRCGFLIGDPRLISALDPLRAPFNVNGLAACLGAQLLESDPGRPARLAAAVAARIRLQESLSSLGIPAIPSDTHFCLLPLGARATAAILHLRSLGILIKDLGPVLPGFVRVSLSGELDAQAFLRAFGPWWQGQFDGSRPC